MDYLWYLLARAKESKTNSIRKNTINLYMPTIDDILNIAKGKGFIIKDKKTFDNIDHSHEFLFILKKAS